MSPQTTFTFSLNVVGIGTNNYYDDDDSDNDDDDDFLLLLLLLRYVMPILCLSLGRQPY